MSSVAALLSLALVSSAVMVDDQPYCAVRYRRLCQGKGRHVACQFSVPGPGDSCQNYTQINFSRDLKHFITNYINRRRQRLAAGNERLRGGTRMPRPEMMMLVEWDRELSLLAQRLADQCSFVHDDCRATVRYPYAGQTVGEVKWRRTSESDDLIAQRAIRRVFDAWWGERRRVTPRQIAAPFRLTPRGTVWGHFSQLAVWKLRAVGCGAVKHGVDQARLLLVCDFSHTNMLGQKTITPGPLAPCPIHTVRKARCSYPLLCAPVKHTSPAIDVEENDSTYDYEFEDSNDDDVNNEDEYDDISNSPTPIELTTMSRRDPFIDEQMQTVVDKGHVETVAVKDDDYDPFVKEHSRWRPTKARSLDLLDEELHRPEKQRSDVSSNEQLRRPSGQWRENQDINLQEQRQAWKKYVTSKRPDNLRDSNVFEFYQQPARGISTLVEDGRLYGPMRHRWKYTMERPRRPSTEALVVTSSTTKRSKPAKQSGIISLMTDKEHIEQLFKDTGFNPNWREQKLQQKQQTTKL